MAGAFLAGGSAAPIAAFTAIARRGRRRFAPAGPEHRGGWRGATMLLRDAKPALRRKYRAKRDGQKPGAAAENSCPAPLQTGSGRRLLASIEKTSCRPAPP